MTVSDGDSRRVPNLRLSRARQGTPSPSGSGQQMSPQELAEAVNAYLWHRHGKQVHLDRSYISKLEVGKHYWPNALYREAFRHVLHAASDAELGFYARRRPGNLAEASPPGAGAVRSAVGAGEERSRLPDLVRMAILAADSVDDGPAEKSLERLQSLATHTHLAYQRADYDGALVLVPALMAATSTLTEGGADPRHAEAAAAEAHLAVSKLALKFGDAQLAWLAGDRARCHAVAAGIPALRAAALFSIGCALLALPDRRHEAADLVEHTLAGITSRRLGGPADISSAGALTLLAAIVAVWHNDHRRAATHLHAAGALAERLGGDRNDLWTAFGPTNVLIHRVGITATTDPDKAINLGEHLDTSRLHAALVSRRSQVHLDLAAAFSHRPRGDASAVLHLLQAEHLAPQLFRIHPPAHALIQRLLSRERRAVTPGLRDLAARAGVAGS